MQTLPPIKIDPQRFLRQHCTLPALPTVVHRIQEIVQGDNVEIAKVVDLISTDPGLVAQILKIVNSAYYGLPREISEIRFSIAFLGLNEVYRLVLSLSVINTLSIEERDEVNKFWFHSFYTALCTKHLAKKFDRQLSFEELWSASILHDIGKLVYLKFFSEHYRVLQAYCSEQGCLFNQAERHFELPSSAYLGTLLCDHWRLPAKIEQACESHTLGDLLRINASQTRHSFERMICLGNLTAVLSTDQLNDATKHEIAQAIITSLGCGESDFLPLMGEIYDLRIEVERFMDKLR